MAFVEATFPNGPQSFVLWTACDENSASIMNGAEVYTEATPDNIYAVKLVITDRMQPGNWSGTWYYISDKYGAFVQADYTGIRFVVE